MRETRAALCRRLDDRTEVVLDTATQHFDNIFDEVKAAVESLDWKVQGHSKGIWWLKRDTTELVKGRVADIERRI